jgi:hypothetical protein
LARVCFARSLRSGCSAKVLIGKPFIITARLAAGVSLRKSLRLILFD